MHEKDAVNKAIAAKREQIGYMRDERKFDELPIEEKLERLRNEVRDLRRSLSYAQQAASAARDIAQSHEHNASGEVMVKADHRGSTIAGGVCSSFDALA